MLTRRTFLVNGLRVTAAVPLLPYVGRGSRDPLTDRVLVAVQLTGGNDAVNMVVPHRQDAYYRLRPTLSLDPKSLHALDEDHGLHPGMGGLAELYAEGSLGVLHGVGYPHPDRSHFRSMEIWHTADPDGPPGRLGWMGRLADQIAHESPGSLAALHVGGGDLPLALHGRDTFAPTVGDASGFRLREPAGFATHRARVLAAGPSEAEIAFLREAAETTYRAAKRMQHAADSGGGDGYPGFELAHRLRLVAQLLGGGFDTRLFYVTLGGFDTHARQAPTQAGLLTQLSQALTAFHRDLETRGIAERVLTFVFSEFGRRVAENGSKGTDHGAAAPVLLVGDRVRGGMHGTPPDLLALEEGDVAFSTDFRSLNTTLERDWMGLAPSTRLPALDVLAV